MRHYHSLTLLLSLFFILFMGCEKYSRQEKYQKPDWLPGKLYTTVEAQENLTMFAECLRLAGLDTILDVSGSFTVFAPTDNAIEQYLAGHHYSGVSDIPPDELEKLVEFHVIQNPWTLEQLQSLSIWGWRTDDNWNTESYAYKRQTILKNPVEKYWIVHDKSKEKIVLDSTISDGYKKVFVGSRKYVPIFYDAYMDVNGLTSEDYSFYFEREYERGNVFYAGAKILQSDIFAENGFVHIIDRVVSPMLNAKELLEREMPGESYQLFLGMVYWYYPTFEPNISATNNQPEVRFGGVVDTLWDLSYYPLPFALHQESTGEEGATVNLSLVRHNGMYVPADNAFREFVDGILTSKSGYPHWVDEKSLPRDVSKIIITPHFKATPIYPSSRMYERIFREESKFRQDENDIFRREFGSNCTFIGLDSYAPDRVFTSVTGPVFLRPTYSLFRRAMLYSNIANEVAGYDGELCFFTIPDYALMPDSSLILNWIDFEEDEYNFTEYNRTIHKIESLSGSTISDRIRNHVGTSLPDGSANKEFIRTLGGQYIIWDHSNNTVRGNRPSTIGYNGNEVTSCTPARLGEPADNGEAWSVRYWFNNENINMRTVLSKYTMFFSLLVKAELFDQYSTGNSFLSRNENYTVFVPSDEALDAYRADTLSTEALGEFLKYHFVRGSIIFTDNKQPSGEYPTTSGESLHIRMGPDLIEILDETGAPYVVIPENEYNTNIMVSERSTVSSVVHEIDKVLTAH